jgi:hypothetical protein
MSLDLSTPSRSAVPYRSNEGNIDTTLIPPGTQYGATWGKSQKGKPFGYAVFATLCKALQHLIYHT